MAAGTVGILALVGVSGGASQWLAWKLRLPSILLLLLAGILLGPTLGWLDADALLGDLLFPFVSVAVAIILFEGGLTLNREDIRQHGVVVRNLLTLGLVVTWVSMAALTHWLFDFSWPMAFLFGGIGVVTGPTVIKPLLRIVRPNEKIAHVLHWEGILVDPIGAMLAIVVFEYIVEVGAGGGYQDVAFVILRLIAVGAVFGLIAGFALGTVFKKRWVPDFLKESTTLLVVIGAFALSEMIQHEAGLLTVTIMGIVLANTKGLRLQEILHFKENLSVLLISALFILLASRLNFDAIAQLGFSAIVFLLVVQFVIRPISVWLSTLGSKWTWQERVLTGWIAPRGIVAAAISSLFVLRLESENVPGSESLVPLAFVMIIGTVVFQSLTAKWVADRLDVSNPEPNGMLIIGANKVAQAIGSALQSAGVKVQLIDSRRSLVKSARENGLPTFFGSVSSSYAESHLDTTAIGQVIALSHDQDLNQLTAMHYRDEFGTENIYIARPSEHTGSEPGDFSDSLTAFRYLFDDSVTYSSLRQALNGEAGIEVIDTEAVESMHESNDGRDGSAGAHNQPLPESIRNDASSAAAGDDVPSDSENEKLAALLGENKLLFAIDKDGKPTVHTEDTDVTLDEGVKLIVLATPSQP